MPFRIRAGGTGGSATRTEPLGTGGRITASSHVAGADQGGFARAGTARAQFLARGARGGLALVAGGLVLGTAEGAALGAVGSDADIAKLAATAGLLAIDVYRRAIASPQLSGDELSFMVGARGNEEAHYAALKGVLGKAARPG